jgi:2-polyprenyl-3-methyl-5-hydroxy-6-metoxy-1,4-benzoquinol methylase
MQKFFDANKIVWNKKVGFHFKSDFYDVAGFRKGKSSLQFIELQGLGDVEGKSMLHLQCHFGLDSLSWAKLGAKVTAVDFSEEAITTAKSLSTETSIKADFICSNIYDLKEVLNKKFDIVFTSYGVIGWLPDLKHWAEIISYFLKPSGIFYMVEFHPVVWMFDDNLERFQYSYFKTEEPIAETIAGTYADRNADINETVYSWNHSLSEVINSLSSNNLKLEYLNEFPFSVYNCFANTVKGPDGWWRIKGLEDIIPLMYSIKAVKKSNDN